MPRHNSPSGNVLAGLGQILIGVGMLAVAAGETIAALKQGQRPDVRPGARSLADIMSNGPQPRRRRPPGAGLPIPAVPPRGPLPLQGGAAAPIDFGS